MCSSKHPREEEEERCISYILAVKNSAKILASQVGLRYQTEKKIEVTDTKTLIQSCKFLPIAFTPGHKKSLGTWERKKWAVLSGVGKCEARIYCQGKQ